MNVLLLLSLLFFFPLLLWLAFLAVSSCMGDRLRARVAGISFNPSIRTFGRNYGRGLGSGSGAGGWEQIEMEDMMGSDSEDE
jgi:hypothetical protein